MALEVVEQQWGGVALLSTLGLAPHLTPNPSTAHTLYLDKVALETHQQKNNATRETHNLSATHTLCFKLSGVVETNKRTVLGKQSGSNRLDLGHVKHFSTGSLTPN